MKRIMTLIGTIVGVVFDAIFSIVMLIGITAILDLLGGVDVPGKALVAVVGILETALGVATLVLNAMCIPAFSWDSEKYAKKRGLLITAIVFNILLTLLLLLALTEGVSILSVLAMLASVAAATLIIVDLCLESKRVSNQELVEQAVSEEKEEVK